MSSGLPLRRAVPLTVLLVATVLPPGAHGWAEYMTEVTTYCYKHLMSDASCCKDQNLPHHVQFQEINRDGASWECVFPADGGSCLDEFNGMRGKDLYWWPQGADCMTPRILFVHGGGWQRHGPNEASYDVLAAKLASVTRAAVLVPDYPLVPTGNHENILEHLVAAWQWLASHGPESEDCSLAPLPPMFIAGDSSGAASALSMLLSVQSQAQATKATGFFAFSPWINLACDTPTYYSNAFAMVGDEGGGKMFVGDILFRGAPANNTHSLRSLALKYLGGRTDLLGDPIFSPFHATEEQLDALPPVYIAVSGTEVIGGDGTIFANRLAWRGIPAYLDIFPGMWHGFEQHSEGCGSGKELWQAGTALSHAGDFVMQISKLSSSNGGHIPRGGQRTPRTNVYYPHPEDKAPWSPVGELNLGLYNLGQEGAGQEVSVQAVGSPAPAPIVDSSQVSVQAAASPAPAPIVDSFIFTTTPKVEVITVPELVQPRALPDDLSCSQETLIGAALSGLLAGCILTFTLVCCTSWFLSRRTQGELPGWLPKFVRHPFENLQDEQRFLPGHSHAPGWSEDERLAAQQAFKSNYR